MKATLKKDGYSGTEKRIFNALAAGKPMTADRLKPRVYLASDKKKPALNWRIIVNNAVRSLRTKMSKNREAFKINRIKHAGKREIETVMVKR